MKDQSKSKEQLTSEIEALKKRIDDLESSEAELIAAEEALKESETRFRELFENMSSGVAVYEAGKGGEDFFFKDFNKAAESIDNIERERVIGRSVLEVFPGVKDFGLFDVFKRVFETGNPERHPVSLYEDERIVGWRENYVYRLPSGEIVAVYDDVTDRKRAEELLRESEERHRGVFENTGTATVIIEEDTTISMANAEYEKLTGYAKDEIEGKMSWMETAHPEDLERMKGYHDRRRQSGADVPKEYVFRLIDRQGRVKDIYGRIDLLPGTKKSVASLLDITSRRQMEKALKESEERYRELVEGTDDVIARIDREGCIIFINSAGERILGMSRKDCLGRAIFDFVHPEDHERAMTAFETWLKNQVTSVNFETRILSKGGRVHHMHFNINLHFDGGAEPVFLNAIGRDLTDLKDAEEELRRAYDKLEERVEERTAELFELNLKLKKEIEERRRVEDALRESQERFDLAVKGSTDGLWDWQDITDDRVWWSPRFFELLGFREGEIEASHSSFLGRLHEDDMERTLDAIRAHLDAGEPFDVECRLKTKSGRYRWFRTRGQALRDEDGNPFRMSGSIQDITAHKLGEEERLRLATAVEQAAEAVIITDLEGGIQYANPAAQRLSGYTARELGGKNLSHLKSKRHDEVFFEALYKTLGKGRVWTDRMTNRAKDGAEYEVEATVSSIRNEKGEITNYVAVERDVTHEVQLEKMLAQAQKMEAIGTLAGGIAHDFNNILTPIIVNAEMTLLKVPDESPMRIDLEQVLAAANRARDLIRHILTFSRQTQSEMKPVSLGEILEESNRLIRASLPTTIEIKQYIEAEEDIVMADSTQIQQVLLNLSTNAYHAMREKGGLLEMRLKDAEIDPGAAAGIRGIEPGSYLRLTVRDTGCGMHKSVVDRIFEPYFTTKNPTEGTGLGLSVVHGIIKNHGGAITVESEPGEGTRFEMYLPRYGSGPSEKTEAVEVVKGSGERILLVDDEMNVVKSLKAMLEHLGYEVVGKTSSVEALKEFLAQPEVFDLVITDQTMPGMTGLELSEELLEARPDIPIILCTGFSEVITEKTVKALGIRDFMMKPFVAREIASSIRRVLESEHGRERG